MSAAPATIPDLATLEAEPKPKRTSKAAPQDKPETAPTKPRKRTAFQAARRAAVPIVAVETPDPAATMARLVDELNGRSKETPIMVWDLCRGLRPWTSPTDGRVPNELAAEYIAEAAPEPALTLNPVECLTILASTKAPTIPKKAIVFMLGAPRFIQDGQGFNAGALQGVWNCRDIFAAYGATLVLLGGVFILPPELSRDVVMISEDLPDPQTLAAICNDICGDAGVPKLEGDDLNRATDTLRGLAAFEARQTFSMSIDPETGVDFRGMWQRKVKAIEACKGLTVYQGAETLDDVAGLSNAKRIYSQTMNSDAFRASCVVFIDEIDKGLAAVNSDSSGTTQDQNKALLSYTQDYDILGSLLLGPPGTGKTLLAKALANTFRVPLIMVDLGAMKDSLVGGSEANMRNAIRVIHAISGGKAFFIGACNRDAGLPPELRRRFSYQLLFVDLPDKEELAGAWKVHTQRLRFQREVVTLPPQLNDWQDVRADGWTGAEVRNCCLKAYVTGQKLTACARTIVPISKSAGDVVEALRRTASGRYTSASREGVYTFSGAQEPVAVGRKMGA